MCPETNGKFGGYKLVFEHLFVFPEAAVFPDHHGLFRAAHKKSLACFLMGEKRRYNTESALNC